MQVWLERDVKSVLVWFSRRTWIDKWTSEQCFGVLCPVNDDCENCKRRSNLLSELVKINIRLCGKECFCWCSTFTHPVQETFCIARIPLLYAKNIRLMMKGAGHGLGLDMLAFI